MLYFPLKRTVKIGSCLYKCQYSFSSLCNEFQVEGLSFIQSKEEPTRERIICFPFFSFPNTRYSICWGRSNVLHCERLENDETINLTLGKGPVNTCMDHSTDVDPGRVPFSGVFLFCVTLLFILRDASCLVLPCSLPLCFFSPFIIVITSLGEEGAGLCASRAFVCSCLHVLILSFLLSSWCRGLASDCGTPWTFLLIVLEVYIYGYALTELDIWINQVFKP